MRLTKEIAKGRELFCGEKYVVFPYGGGYFEGVKRVCEFSPEKIALALKSGALEISGEGLEIAKICDGDVSVSGKIYVCAFSPSGGEKHV